ncbi:MAG: hypothetical protein ACREX3_12550 [Gammaproteobacteria bacterium]
MIVMRVAEKDAYMERGFLALQQSFAQRDNPRARIEDKVMPASFHFDARSVTAKF